MLTVPGRPADLVACKRCSGLPGLCQLPLSHVRIQLARIVTPDSVAAYGLCIDPDRPAAD